MKKLETIFWNYFLEKRRGRVWIFSKEPKANDRLGMKLFGLMNFTGFLMSLIMAGIFIYLLFIGRLFGRIDIVWPISIGGLFIAVGIWGVIGII